MGKIFEIKNREGIITRSGPADKTSAKVNIEEGDFSFVIRDSEDRRIVYQTGSLSKKKKANDLDHSVRLKHAEGNRVTVHSNGFKHGERTLYIMNNNIMTTRELTAEVASFDLPSGVNVISSSEDMTSSISFNLPFELNQDGMNRLARTDREKLACSMIEDMATKDKSTFDRALQKALAEWISKDEELYHDTFLLYEKAIQRGNTRLALINKTEWSINSDSMIELNFEEADRVIVYKDNIYIKEVPIKGQVRIVTEENKVYTFDFYKGNDYLSSGRMHSSVGKIRSKRWEYERENISKIKEAMERSILPYSMTTLSEDAIKVAAILDEQKIDYKPLSHPVIVSILENEIEFVIPDHEIISELSTKEKPFYICGREITRAFTTEYSFKEEINSEYIIITENIIGHRLNTMHTVWIEDSYGNQVTDPIYACTSEKDLENLHELEIHSLSKAENHIIQSVRGENGSDYESLVRDCLSNAQTDYDYTSSNAFIKTSEAMSQGKALSMDLAQSMVSIISSGYKGRIFDTKFFYNPIKIVQSFNELVIEDPFRNFIAIVATFDPTDSKLKNRYLHNPEVINIIGKDYAIVRFIDKDTYLQSGFALFNLRRNLELVASWNLEMEVLA